jgi:predicted nucleic acid-binding protein
VADEGQYVYDIRSYEPRPEHRFLVDTNAWYWITYSRATLAVASGRPTTRQHEQYLRFLKKALNVGCTIVRCDLILSELAHRIESTEKKIYEARARVPQPIFPKDYRAMAEQRRRVVSEVTNAWAQVTSMSEACEFPISSEVTKGALESFRKFSIGGYDLFLLEAMKHRGLQAILTDDSDFSAVSGISILTSNVRVIQEAQEAGRLIQ